MKLRILTGVLALAAMVGTAPMVSAADHIDSPNAVNAPAADITDLFAWMTSDTEALNLIMGVWPLAGPDAAFPTDVTYAFHVNSSAAYGDTQEETQVICRFYDETNIECWAGDEYVSGDPSDPSGITSASGALRVFAGQRNDPFYMEFTGFSETVSTVIDAASGLTFDANGCPELDTATSNALVSQLSSGAMGAPASDFFAGANVLALVVQIDTDVVNGNGPLLSVWGSTHR